MNPTPSTPEKAPVAEAQAKKTSPKPKKAKKPMAKKKVAKSGVNKSEEIRKLATELKAKGEKVRPVTIQTMLKKRGIEVAAPQVSMVLKKMGFKPRKRRKSGASGAASPVVKKMKSGGDLSFTDLQKVKRVVEEFGGAKNLIDAVTALVELQ
jgi:transposase